MMELMERATHVQIVSSSESHLFQCVIHVFLVRGKPFWVYFLSK